MTKEKLDNMLNTLKIKVSLGKEIIEETNTKRKGARIFAYNRKQMENWTIKLHNAGYEVKQHWDNGAFYLDIF